MFTGDFTAIIADRGARTAHLRAHGAGTPATVGIFGNHDSPGLALGLPRTCCPARDCGIRVLRNEGGDVDGLDVVGFDDRRARRFEPAGALGHRMRLSRQSSSARTRTRPELRAGRDPKVGS